LTIEATVEYLVSTLGADKAVCQLTDLYFSLPWTLGDALMKCDNIPNVRISDTQAYDFDRVARMWPPGTRLYGLPWSYYRDAGSDIELAERVLDATERNGWSREQMRSVMKTMRREGHERG
jgi:hypothetical protein